MSGQDKIQLFEDQPIRTAWDAEQEEWFFSVVDVVGILTEQPTPRNASTYWAVLKKRLKNEGADQLLTNCKQLKLKSPKDGKRYSTDVATTEQLLRIIQSIPSPKAEPFKLWLAQVGRERIEETIDPEQAIDRALKTYLKKGYSSDWVHQRVLAIRVRNELTAEWQARGVEKGREYAILTDEITRAWSGMTTGQYKNLYSQPQTPCGRVFFRHTALRFLAIHKVFLRKRALSGEKIPRPPGIFGCEYRF